MITYLKLQEQNYACVVQSSLFNLSYTLKKFLMVISFCSWSYIPFPCATTHNKNFILFSRHFFFFSQFTSVASCSPRIPKKSFVFIHIYDFVCSYHVSSFPPFIHGSFSVLSLCNLFFSYECYFITCHFTHTFFFTMPSLLNLVLP